MHEVLHGFSDIGSELLIRFRFETLALNEELGRHSNGNDEVKLF